MSGINYENDSDWQRRSDGWVDASHKSRLRKEKALEDKKHQGDVKKEKNVENIVRK